MALSPIPFLCNHHHHSSPEEFSFFKSDSWSPWNTEHHPSTLHLHSAILPYPDNHPSSFFLIYKLKHFIFLGCCSLVAESCLTLCYPMDCSPQGSMGFPRQEYWSALPFLLHEIILSQGLNMCLLHCRQILYCWVSKRSPLLILAHFISNHSFYLGLIKCVILIMSKSHQ